MKKRKAKKVGFRSDVVFTNHEQETKQGKYKQYKIVMIIQSNYTLNQLRSFLASFINKLVQNL